MVDYAVKEVEQVPEGFESQKRPIGNLFRLGKNQYFSGGKRGVGSNNEFKLDFH